MGQAAFSLDNAAESIIEDAGISLQPKSSPLFSIVPKKVALPIPESFTEKASRAFTPIIVTLLLMQMFDGLLTAFGVSQFGLAAEGNPLIRQLMQVIGFAPALVFVKGLSCLVIVVLAFQSLKTIWLPRMLQLVAAFYLVAAILPWTFILFGNVA